jgi:hypothetical protein
MSSKHLVTAFVTAALSFGAAGTASALMEEEPWQPPGGGHGGQVFDMIAPDGHWFGEGYTAADAYDTGIGATYRADNYTVDLIGEESRELTIFTGWDAFGVAHYEVESQRMINGAGGPSTYSSFTSHAPPWTLLRGKFRDFVAECY